jgi:hypothetical protein
MRFARSTKEAFPNERFYAVECFTPRRSSFLSVKVIALALIGLVLLISTQLAKASDSWSAGQQVLAAGAIALHLADWSQTRAISSTPGYEEKAPITKAVIGSHPDEGKVDAYMVVTGLLILGAAHLLPEYRTAILATWAATRLAVVVHNNSIGLRIGGSF